MAKLTLTNIAQGFSTSTVARINANNAATEAALEKTLSRDGTSPNSMEADLDMNSNQILNLPQAVEDTEPVRKIEFDAGVDTASQAAIDAANAAEQALNILEAVTGIGNATINLPVANGDISTKEYADLVTGGNNLRLPVAAATTTTLPAFSYTSATGTARAHIIANSNGALSAIDGITLVTGNRLLVKDEAFAIYNDVYVVTQGTVNTPWRLDRAAELDVNVHGEVIVVSAGSVNGSKLFLRSDGSNVYTDTALLLSGTDFIRASEVNSALPSVTTPATVGDSSHIPIITYDSKGRITSSTTATLAAVSDASQLTSGILPAARLPTPTSSTLGGVKSLSAVSTKFLNSIGTDGTPTQVQPAASDISGLAASATTDTTSASNISSGTLPAARLPNPSASTLGGVKSLAAVSHQFLTSISTAGLPTQAQPAASDISGLAASATTDTTNANNITSGTLPDARLSATISPATVGDSSHVPVITFDAKGRLTAVTSQAISSSSFTVGVVSPGVNSVIGNDTTDKTTIASIISASGIITFYPGTYLFDANTTWPAGKIYIVHPGAYIKVSSTKTLTINGILEAGPYKIFGTSATGKDLSGIVTGLAKVNPFWWGIELNSSSTSPRDIPTNNSSCFQLAWNSLTGSGSSDCIGRRTFTIPTGTIYISVSVDFILAPGLSYLIEGAGPHFSIILTTSSFTGGYGLFIGPNAGGITTSDIIVKDFRVLNNAKAGGPGYGIKLGPTSGLLHFIGAKSGLVENVTSSGYNVCWQIQNCRLLTFQRASSWSTAVDGEVTNSVGWVITAFSGGLSGTWSSFCGDMDFYDCQFVAPGGDSDGDQIQDLEPSGVGVTINDLGTAATHLSGIRFHACIFYGGNKQLEFIGAGTSSQIDDTWVIDGSQFEGPAGLTPGGYAKAISGYVNNGSIFSDLHFDSLYLIGNGHYKDFEFLIHSGGGTLQAIIITNCVSNNCLHEIVDIRAGDGLGNSYGSAHLVTVSNNIIRSPNGTHGSGSAAIYLESITAATACGNNMYSTSGGNTRAYLVFFNGGGNYFTATGNNSGGRATTASVASGVGGSTNGFSGNI